MCVCVEGHIHGICTQVLNCNLKAGMDGIASKYPNPSPISVP